jgi:hypothetical protein
MLTNLIESKPFPMGVVVGALRNVDGTWEVITDTNHTPVNIDTVTTTGTDITVNYTSLDGIKVGSFVAVPDETLARQGFFCGASVSATSAVISMSQAIPSYSDYVAYTGGAWVSANGVFTCAYSGGVLTLTHPALIGVGANVSLTGRDGTTIAYTPSISGGSSTTATTLNIVFRDSAGAIVTTPDTNMRVYATHGGGLRSVNPSEITTTIYPNSNIWLMGMMQTA